MNNLWISYILILVLVNCGRTASQSATVTAQTPEKSIFNSMFNSLQLGLKRVIDYVVPNYPIFPTDFGGQKQDATLPDPINSIIPTGCPTCFNLDYKQLPGLWHLIYANDNFIKNQLGYLERSTMNQAIGGDGKPVAGVSYTDLFTPMRNPTCVKLQIANLQSLGPVLDFPVYLSFRAGLPTGSLIGGAGILRNSDYGTYSLSINGGNFKIKFCATDANFITKIIETDSLNPDFGGQILPREFGLNNNFQSAGFNNLNNINNNFNNLNNLNNPHNLGPQQQQPVPNAQNGTKSPSANQIPQNQQPFPGIGNIVNPPKYMILSDTSGFPACQNYAVFSTEPSRFFALYERTVVALLSRHGGNQRINPLQYVGCPDVFLNIV